MPPDQRSRVLSIDSFGSAVRVPIGLVVTATLTDRFGPAAVFVVAGTITACLVACGLAHPAVRHLD